jgi:hypothetical protein
MDGQHGRKLLRLPDSINLAQCDVAEFARSAYGPKNTKTACPQNPHIGVHARCMFSVLAGIIALPVLIRLLILLTSGKAK